MTDPICAAARDLAAVLDRLHAIDVSGPRQATDPGGYERWRMADNVLHDEKEAIEDRILAMRAGSLAGAALQVMLALSRNDDSEGAEPSDAAWYRRQIDRALYSALPLIVQAAGIQLGRLGDYYAAEGASPFAAFDFVPVAAPDEKLLVKPAAEAGAPA